MPEEELLVTESCPNFSVTRVCLGVIRIILPPNARITEDDCVRTRAELLSLSGGKPGAVILQITGVGSVSRTAISLYSDGPAVTAFAILGCTPVDRVIALTLLRLAPPQYPTNYFTDEGDALIWLRTLPGGFRQLGILGDRGADVGSGTLSMYGPHRRPKQAGPSP